jgi:CheY-like chemotaxis protein
MRWAIGRILIDIQLPIMDGYEVTRQIKAHPATRSIPIIAVTSHVLDGEERGLRCQRRKLATGRHNHGNPISEHRTISAFGTKRTFHG